MLERAAGVVIPLFSLWTARDLGRGEILDLIEFCEFASDIRHRVIQLLPIGEGAPDEASPYNAQSIFAIDPMYISVAELPRMPESEVKRARRALGSRRLAARSEVARVKLPLLERAFRDFTSQGRGRERAALEKFAEQNRDWLEDYALFRALKERFAGETWAAWPAELRDRQPAAIAAARRALKDTVSRVVYWQFVARRQWAEMREAIRKRGALIGGDLAFLPAKDSAEVWANQELFEFGRSVGAPPDAFSASGQRWGLPMPNWPRMRAEGWRWWRARVKDAVQLYDLFRIDHVAGFYRTFSFASEQDHGDFFPADQAAQLEQGEEILKMIKDAASGAEVLAEDLGTVPAWVRESLTRLGIAGFKVLRWEKEDWGTERESYIAPQAYPELSVATTGTHDTETLAVWWERLEADERMRLLRALGDQGRIDPERSRFRFGVLDAVLERLYRSPSRLVLVPIQDLFGWSARINLPGSIGPKNWVYRLPMTLEKLRRSPAIERRMSRIRAMAERSGRWGRGKGSQ